MGVSGSVLAADSWGPDHTSALWPFAQVIRTESSPGSTLLLCRKPKSCCLSIHHTELDFKKYFRMADVESLIVPLIETSTGEVKGWA